MPKPITPEALAEARIKRWALDKSVCRLFPETKGAWVKFADVEALIAAATAAERERCAKVCEAERDRILSVQSQSVQSQRDYDPVNTNLRLIAHMGADKCADEIRRGG